MIATNSTLDKHRLFTTRYNKHIKANNHPYIKSNFAEHILGTPHKYTNIQTNYKYYTEHTRIQN